MSCIVLGNIMRISSSQIAVLRMNRTTILPRRLRRSLQAGRFVLRAPAQQNLCLTCTSSKSSQYVVTQALASRESNACCSRSALRLGLRSVIQSMGI